MIGDIVVDNIGLVLVGVVVLCMLWLLARRPSGFPPGPRRLPLLGNVLSMDRDPRVAFSKLRRQYGDIFSVYIFHKPIIVLNGYDVLKEALVKNADVFSDRPHSFITDYISKGLGIVSTSGALWREQRRFALNTLREFGMGRSVLEDKIQEELSFFLKAIDETQGEAFNCKRLVQNSVSNIICSIVFGSRFEYTDPLFLKCLRCMDENFENASNIMNVFPLLRFVPGDPFKIKQSLRNVDIVKDELNIPSIEKHMKEFSEDNLNDFISVYIKEMRQRQQEGEETTMNVDNLQRCISDLFGAGTETTATTIRWALVYFLNYPDVQEKCFQEIKENVGLNRPPSMKDKTSLPYLEATITEIMRCVDIVPIGVPHTVSEDVHFRGYTIPKGVIVATILDSVLQDPDVWGDPENFRPERFLDGKRTFEKRDEFIPFSLGRRVCLGQSMARMELFLFLGAMIQQFQFTPAGEERPSLKGIMGLTHAPSPFNIRATPRV